MPEHQKPACYEKTYAGTTAAIQKAARAARAALPINQTRIKSEDYDWMLDRIVEALVEVTFDFGANLDDEASELANDRFHKENYPGRLEGYKADAQQAYAALDI